MSKSKERPGRLIAIGDIHGHSVSLSRLLRLVKPKSNDIIVTLGDYVNRGPDARGVIDLLITLSNHCRLIPVLGNHDEMMLDCLHDENAEKRFRYLGGDETFQSYATHGSIEAVPESHWKFLKTCVAYFETKDTVFTHANYCWYSELIDQPSSLLRWTSITEVPPKPHVSGKSFVVGHTPGPIRDLGFCCCIDTGCGFGEVLTAMEVSTREVWQVAQ